MTSEGRNSDRMGFLGLTRTKAYIIWFIGITMLLSPVASHARDCIEIWIPGNFTAIKQAVVPDDQQCPDYDAWTPTFFPAVDSEEALKTEPGVEPIGSMTVGAGAELIWPFDVEIGPDMQVRADRSNLTLQGGNDVSHWDPTAPSLGIVMRGGTFTKTGLSNSRINVPISVGGGEIVVPAGRLTVKAQGNISMISGLTIEGDVVLDGGVFRGSGVEQGNYTWRSGTIGGFLIPAESIVTIVDGGDTRVTGSTNIFDENGRGGLSNSGLIRINGDIDALTAEPGGVSANFVTSNGEIEKSSGPGTASIGQGSIGASVDGGRITSKEGRLEFDVRFATIENSELDAQQGEIAFVGNGSRVIEGSVMTGNFEVTGAGQTSFRRTTISGRVHLNGGRFELNDQPQHDGVIVLENGTFGTALAPVSGDFTWIGGVMDRFELGAADPSSAMLRIPSGASPRIANLTNDGTISIEDDIDLLCAAEMDTRCALNNSGIIRKVGGENISWIGESGDLSNLFFNDLNGQIRAQSGVLKFSLAPNPPGLVTQNNFTGTSLITDGGQIEFSGSTKRVFSDVTLSGNIEFIKSEDNRFLDSTFSGNVIINGGKYSFSDATSNDFGLVLRNGKFETAPQANGILGSAAWEGGVADGLIFGGPQDRDVIIRLQGAATEIGPEDLINYGRIEILEDHGVLAAVEQDFGSAEVINHGEIVKVSGDGVSTIGDERIEFTSIGGRIVSRSGVLEMNPAKATFESSQIIAETGNIVFVGKSTTIEGGSVDGTVFDVKESGIGRFSGTKLDGVEFKSGVHIFSSINEQSGSIVLEQGTFNSPDVEKAGLRGRVSWKAGDIGVLVLGDPQGIGNDTTVLAIESSGRKSIGNSIHNWAKITGSGSIGGSGSIINNGTLSPGSAQAKFGVISTTGGLELDGGGRLLIDIGKNNRGDAIEIQGPRMLELDGELVLRLDPGVKDEFGSDGTAYELIGARSIAGAFSSIMIEGAGSLDVDVELAVEEKPSGRQSLVLKVSKSEVLLLPECLDFGDNLLQSSSISDFILVENRGFSEVLVEEVTVEGLHAADFSVVSDSDQCSGASLLDEEFCGFQIEFSPLGPGARKASVSVETSSPDRRLLAELQGTADVIFMDRFGSSGCQ